MKNYREKYRLNYLRSVAVAVKQVIFPTRCLTCHSLFHVQAPADKTVFPDSIDYVFNRLIAPFMCATCSSGFLPITSPICPCCGMMFKSREGEDHLCGECMASRKSFDIARSAGIYEKALMNAIHCFKYKGKIQLARPLGSVLLSVFVNCWDGRDIDAIIPVPLHRRKIKTRSFNPSILMVRSWQRLASRMALSIPKILVLKDVLVKIKWTEPQTGLTRKKRIENVKNSFVVNDPSRIEGRRILLVDDVFTTGATANECAKVLRKGGATGVDVLTLARTII